MAQNLPAGFGLAANGAAETGLPTAVHVALILAALEDALAHTC